MLGRKFIQNIIKEINIEQGNSFTVNFIIPALTMGYIYFFKINY